MKVQNNDFLTARSTQKVLFACVRSNSNSAQTVPGICSRWSRIQLHHALSVPSVSWLPQFLSLCLFYLCPQKYTISYKLNLYGRLEVSCLKATCKPLVRNFRVSLLGFRFFSRLGLGFPGMKIQEERKSPYELTPTGVSPKSP